jgi:hypothetical protein
MIWPAMLFNLCVALLLAGYLLRAVRRFERTVDRIEGKMEASFAEQMLKYDAARGGINRLVRGALECAIQFTPSGSTPLIGELEPLDGLFRRNPVRYEVLLARVRNLDAEAANAAPAKDVLKSFGVQW